MSEVIYGDSGNVTGVIEYYYTSEGAVTAYNKLKKTETTLVDTEGAVIQTIVVNYDENGNPVN